MTTAGKIISGLLSIPLLVITIFFLFSNSNFPSAYKVFLVQSGSMSPAIKTGDLVVTKPSRKYQKGDIINFVSSNKFNVTHRIVDTKNNRFTTKGDANKTPDQENVDLSQITGKVLYIIPRFGYFIIFVKSLPGLIALIVIPSTIIVYEEIIEIKKNIKKVAEK